jgi:hypothetical protein
MNQEHDQQLKSALIDMEDLSPTRDLWPQVAAQLERPKSRGAWLSLAAGIGLFAVLASLPKFEQSKPDPLAELKQASSQLEAKLQLLREQTPRYSLRLAEIERTLTEAMNLTDLRIALAEDPKLERELWQRRVAVLSTWYDLATLDTGEHTAVLHPPTLNVSEDVL